MHSEYVRYLYLTITCSTKLWEVDAHQPEPSNLSFSSYPNKFKFSIHLNLERHQNDDEGTQLSVSKWRHFFILL